MYGSKYFLSGSIRKCDFGFRNSWSFDEKRHGPGWKSIKVQPLCCSSVGERYLMTSSVYHALVARPLYSKLDRK